MSTVEDLGTRLLKFWIVERAREIAKRKSQFSGPVFARLFRAPSRLSRKGLLAVYRNPKSLYYKMSATLLGIDGHNIPVLESFIARFPPASLSHSLLKPFFHIRLLIAPFWFPRIQPAQSSARTRHSSFLLLRFSAERKTGGRNSHRQ